MQKTYRTTAKILPKKSGKSWFSKAVAWIHLWPSLVSAVILIFVCLTGTIIVYCDEIMEFSAGRARFVEQVGTQRLEPDELIERLKAQFPDRGTPGYMVAYKDPSRSVRFNMFSKKEGLRMVYVDPYTGQVLKDDGTIYFFYITAHLHNSLLLHKPGQWIIDIATLIFLIELITGLILWWPRKWTKATRDASFKIKWKAKFKRVNYDLHNVLGFYALGISLVLTVTGLIIAFHPWAEFTLKLFGGNPSHEWMDTLSEHRGDATPASVNATLASLFAQHPQKREAIVYTYSFGKQGHYLLSLAKSAGLKSAEGAEPFAIDRYSGRPIELAHGNRMHLLVENTYWNLHMGKWMGQWGKFFTFVGGLIATSLPITGFYIWWGRRRKNKKRPTQRKRQALNTTADTLTHPGV
ncbi:MAG: PepSY domain-containing protein [Parapedobacter sp.]|nr:MAG: PepSY domain-containing protein [Parapedobacter sp.]